MSTRRPPSRCSETRTPAPRRRPRGRTHSGTRRTLHRRPAAQNSDRRTARIGRTRRRSGESIDPSSVVAPVSATNAPTPAAEMPCRLGEDDHRERNTGGREVAHGDHRDRRPKERHAPKEGESLAQIRPSLRLALLLEARAHEEQRERREGVRDRVGEERHPARNAEQRAPDAGGAASRTTAPRACERLAASASCDCGTTARKAPLLPARKKTPAVESTNATTRISQNDAWWRIAAVASSADRRGADGVGDDHQRAAGRQRSAATPAGRLNSEHRPEHDRPDVAGLLCRMRDREREQRVRDAGHVRAERREELPGLKQHEVAVAPERRHAETGVGKSSSSERLGAFRIARLERPDHGRDEQEERERRNRLARRYGREQQARGERPERRTAERDRCARRCSRGRSAGRARRRLR